MSETAQKQSSDNQSKSWLRPQRKRVSGRRFAYGPTTVDTDRSSRGQSRGGWCLQRQCACGNHTGNVNRDEALQTKRVPGDALAASGTSPYRDFTQVPSFSSATQAAAAQLKELVVNSPGDSYEVEADRVADRVMRHVANPPADVKTPPVISPLPIQRRSLLEGPGLVDLDLSKSRGQPIEGHVQREMESGFGRSFANVHVHNNPNAYQLARSVSARAFTLGSDIYFGQSQYSPGSSEGKRLLAHELTHVVQQGHAQPAAPAKVQRQAREDEETQEPEEEPTPEQENQSLGEVEGQGTPEAANKLEEFNKVEEEEPSAVQRKVVPQLTLDGRPIKPGQQIRHSYEAEATIEPDKLPESIQMRFDEALRSRFDNDTIHRRLTTGDAVPGIQRDCAEPTIESRGSRTERYSKSSWRTYFKARSVATANNNTLVVDMWAFAKAYYGFWYTSETIHFVGRVAISCTRVDSNCEIAADEVAGSDFKMQDDPVSAGISVGREYRRSNRAVALTVRTGASCGGGGAISAGVGPASAGVSFPDQGLARERSHGTFIWTCPQPSAAT